MSDSNLPVTSRGKAAIPVVDLHAVGIGKQGSEEDLQSTASQIHEAFSTIGFVYLINHGIPEQQVRYLSQ